MNTHVSPQGFQFNSTLAIGGVPSPLDSFEVAESSVLRMNFCAEKPAHRQSANRYGQALNPIAYKKLLKIIKTGLLKTCFLKLPKQFLIF
jgi:hypothetical protein